MCCATAIKVLEEADAIRVLVPFLTHEGRQVVSHDIAAVDDAVGLREAGLGGSNIASRHAPTGVTHHGPGALLMSVGLCECALPSHSSAS